MIQLAVRGRATRKTTAERESMWEICCEWKGGEKKQRPNEREARNNSRRCAVSGRTTAKQEES